jgi:hypothetical protein
MRSGTHTSGCWPLVSPTNAGGMMPTMESVALRMASARPMTSPRPPKRRCQKL